MDFVGTLNTELQLGLGLSFHDEYSAEDCMKKKVKNPSKCKNKLYPSLSLGPDEANNICNQPAASKTESYDQYLESSFSISSSMIMREMDQQILGGEEFDIEVEKIRITRRMGDVDEDGNPRKKLRLTKEQSAVLEENFKEHSTLNPKQKQALAKRLNLLARQVEVWFQNRRARTKLKQTESDCEILKKYCETLTEENKSLQKELEELKSMQTVKATTTPFYMQIPAATLTICPCCERLCGGGGGDNSNDSTTKTTLLIGSKSHHHYHKNSYPFPHSSFIHSMLGS